MLGDVNCDGKVDKTDVDYLQKYVQKDYNYILTEQGLKNADVYLDNKIDVKDYSILTKYLNKTAGYEILPYVPKA